MRVEFIPEARIRAIVPSEFNRDLIVFYPTKVYKGDLIGDKLYSKDGKYDGEFQIPLEYVRVIFND